MNEKIIISLIFFLVHVTTFHHHAALGHTTESPLTPVISSEPTDSPTESPAPSPSPSETPTQSTRPSVTGVPTKTKSSPPTVSNRPTDSPTESPAPSPSPSAVPTDFPSSSPSSKPTVAPSVTPTDGPSNLPSLKPSVAPSVTPTDGPSVFPSKSPSSKPSSSPSLAPSFVPSDGPSIYPSVAPSLSAAKTLSNLIPGIFLNGASPTASKEKDIELRSSPTGIPQTMSSKSKALSSQPIGHGIPISGRVPTSLSAVSSQKTINSLFLKQINNPMDSEATIFFSATVLEFLRERVADFIEGVNFTEVEVVWQASETSNSTEFYESIDGMRIYFATIADIDDSIEVDLALLIETAFKVNKEEFLTKLDENSYFLPVGIKGRIIDQEKVREVENQVETKPSTFLNTWVISCLGIVVFSVFVTTLLITKMMKQQAKPRRIQHLLATEEGDNAFEISPRKADMHSWYTAGPSFSDYSTETVRTNNNNKSKSSDIESAELDDNFEVYSTGSQMSNSMALEDESLVGLRLLGPEKYSSTSAPRYTVPALDTYQSSAGLRLLGSEEEEENQQPGNNARMRKRQIEREIQQQGSQEGPSMEAILIATSSFNSDEADGGDQVKKTDATKIQSPKNISCSLKKKSRVEVATGNDKNRSENIIQTTSVLSRFSNIFHRKNKKQHSHQTVQMEEGRSESAIHMQRNNQEEDEDSGIYTGESFNTIPVLDVISAENSISAVDRDYFMPMSASHRSSKKSPRVDKKTRRSKDQRNHTISSSPNESYREEI